MFQITKFLLYSNHSVQMHSAIPLFLFQSSFSEPSTPGNDLGHGTRTNDLAQRNLATTIGTTTSLSKSETETSKLFDGTRSTTENKPYSALPRSETPKNINEIYNGVPSTPTGQTLYKESIPMQESIVDVEQEHRLSLSEMGFERVPASSALAHTGTSQQNDLIVFNSLAPDAQKKEVSLLFMTILFIFFKCIILIICQCKCYLLELQSHTRFSWKKSTVAQKNISKTLEKKRRILALVDFFLSNFKQITVMTSMKPLSIVPKAA